MFFNKKILGNIGYYNLVDWWLNSFTKEEKKIIEDIYKPLGFDTNRKPLTERLITSSSQSKILFLSILAGWFNNPKNRPIANKIIDKAELCIQENPNDFISAHYVYSEMISIYYPQREDLKMFDKVIKACEKQIEIAPKVKIVLEQIYKEQQDHDRKNAKDPLYGELKNWDGEKYVAMKNYDFESEFNAFHMPSHKGYEQLAIILNKQNKNDEAIKLCEQAKAQGWIGDWDKRIDRYKKAKNK